MQSKATAGPTPTPTPTCGGPAALATGPGTSSGPLCTQAALGTDNMLYIAGGLNADNMTTLRPGLAL